MGSLFFWGGKALSERMLNQVRLTPFFRLVLAKNPLRQVHKINVLRPGQLSPHSVKGGQGEPIARLGLVAQARMMAKFAL